MVGTTTTINKDRYINGKIVLFGLKQVSGKTPQKETNCAQFGMGFSVVYLYPNPILL